MCGMRLVSQRIQKENIQSFELTQRRLGNFAVVGQVCSASEAEAINLRVAVYDPHRFEVRSEKIYRTVNRAQLELRQAAIFVIRVEDVAEHLAQECRRIGARVERQFSWLVNEAERTQIIDAKNVVGVSVGVENRIHALDLLANGLRVKIGRGVDKHDLARIFDHH